MPVFRKVFLIKQFGGLNCYLREDYLLDGMCCNAITFFTQGEAETWLQSNGVTIAALNGSRVSQDGLTIVNRFVLADG